MKVYNFLYCSCVYESSFATMSLHKTKAGAYKAMRKYLMEEYQRWYDERILYGKFRWHIKFDPHGDWLVSEMELLD